jgi:hypothetical protein
MIGDRKYKQREDELFDYQIKELTTSLGKDLRYAFSDPDNTRHIDKCLEQFDVATTVLIPTHLKRVGFDVPPGTWELNLTSTRTWEHGSIVLVAHATTEKRRLVIMSDNGTAKNIHPQFRFDMIALSPGCTSGSMSVVRLKPLNLISTRKTWWVMHRPTLDLGFRAIYDKKRGVFNLDGKDEPQLRAIYEKYVDGMEKSPKTAVIQRFTYHKCLEQFMLESYPTPQWKHACQLDRTKTPDQKPKKFMVRSVHPESIDLPTIPKRVRTIADLINEEEDTYIKQKVHVTSTYKSNIKIIRIAVDGTRMQIIENDDICISDAIDDYDHGKETNWEDADNIISDVGMAVQTV